MNFKTWIISTAFLAAVGLVFSVVPSFADDNLNFAAYYRQAVCVSEENTRPANTDTSAVQWTNLLGTGRIGNECDRSLTMWFDKVVQAPREEGDTKWWFRVSADMWTTTDDNPSDPETNGRKDDWRLGEVWVGAENLFRKGLTMRVGMHDTTQQFTAGNSHLHDYKFFDVGGDGISIEQKLDNGLIEFVWFRQGGGQGWTGGTFKLADGGDKDGWLGAISGDYFGLRLAGYKITDDVKLSLRYGMGGNQGGRTPEHGTWGDPMEYDAVHGSIMTGVITFKTGSLGHTVLYEQRNGIFAKTHKNPVGAVGTLQLGKMHVGVKNPETGESLEEELDNDWSDQNDNIKTRFNWNGGMDFGRHQLVASWMYETNDDGKMGKEDFVNSQWAGHKTPETMAKIAALGKKGSMTTWNSIIARFTYHTSKITSIIFEVGKETVEKDIWDDAYEVQKVTIAPSVTANPGWGPSMWVRPLFRGGVSNFVKKVVQNNTDQPPENFGKVIEERNYLQWFIGTEIWM